ncbi:MAG: aminoglycoside phosphotransferase family protein [Nocardioides sp.]
MPASLVENLAYTLGDEGARVWLDGAVVHARELMAAWSLRPLEVLAGGSMSLCIRCVGADGEELVLKVPAGLESGAAEIAALRAWGGNGAARVVREHPESSAMLMNYLGRVGEGEYGLEDVVDLTERLHLDDPAGYPFGTVEQNLAGRVRWAAERFGEDGYEHHQADLALAEKLVDELVYADTTPVLLHGDLQAKNLIVSGEDLTAVDPLPVVGPALFDVAFWIAKSIHERPTLDYVERVSSLRPDLDAGALLRWTWALAVLENRPQIAAGAQRRQEFIDDLRDEVTGADATRGHRPTRDSSRGGGGPSSGG